ncbi:MAG: hypothetical protein WBX01_11695 [Nitrososphaeraceae archaeon]
MKAQKITVELTQLGKELSQLIYSLNEYGILADQVNSNSSLKYNAFNTTVHNAFDFKFYDDNNRIIILDPITTKTHNTLERVARDLINEGRNILNV